MATAVVFNHFPAMALAVRPCCRKAVAATARAIASTASGMAPRDTGFMADNVYYSSAEGSSYGSGPGPSKKSSYLLEEVRPDSDMQAVVGAAANYSIYVEMGHHVHHSATYVPANPWFFPAVDASGATMDAMMALIAACIEATV